MAPSPLVGRVGEGEWAVGGIPAWLSPSISPTGGGGIWCRCAAVLDGSLPTCGEGWGGGMGGGGNSGVVIPLHLPHGWGRDLVPLRGRSRWLPPHLWGGLGRGKGRWGEFWRGFSPSISPTSGGGIWCRCAAVLDGSLPTCGEGWGGERGGGGNSGVGFPPPSPPGGGGGFWGGCGAFQCGPPPLCGGGGGGERGGGGSS